MYYLLSYVSYLYQGAYHWREPRDIILVLFKHNLNSTMAGFLTTLHSA